MLVKSYIHTLEQQQHCRKTLIVKNIGEINFIYNLLSNYKITKGEWPTRTGKRREGPAARWADDNAIAGIMDDADTVTWSLVQAKKPIISSG